MAAVSWGDDDGDGVLPWVEDRLAELGADTPVLFDETDGIDFEAVNDTRPDVILAGYSNGLRKGTCSINGQTRPILEVGMQSAFVEITESDRVGDEVVLLGEANPETTIAEHWRSSSQEVVVALASSGLRVYEG